MANDKLPVDLRVGTLLAILGTKSGIGLKAHSVDANETVGVGRIVIERITTTLCNKRQ